MGCEPIAGELICRERSASCGMARARQGVLRDGEYVAVVEASGEAGAISFGVPFLADSTPPRVRVLTGEAFETQCQRALGSDACHRRPGVPREVKRAGIVRIPWAGRRPVLSVAGTRPGTERSDGAYPPRLARGCGE